MKRLLRRKNKIKEKKNEEKQSLLKRKCPMHFVSRRKYRWTFIWILRPTGLYKNAEGQKLVVSLLGISQVNFFERIARLLSGKGIVGVVNKASTLSNY